MHSFVIGKGENDTCKDKYYVFAKPGERYLWEDGTVHSACVFVDGKRQGLFQTEEEAREAIKAYHAVAARNAEFLELKAANTSLRDEVGKLQASRAKATLALEKCQYVLKHAPSLYAYGCNERNCEAFLTNVDASGTSGEAYRAHAEELRKQIAEARDLVRGVFSQEAERLEQTHEPLGNQYARLDGSLPASSGPSDPNGTKGWVVTVHGPDKYTISVGGSYVHYDGTLSILPVRYYNEAEAFKALVRYYQTKVQQLEQDRDGAALLSHTRGESLVATQAELASLRTWADQARASLGKCRDFLACVRGFVADVDENEFLILNIP